VKLYLSSFRLGERPDAFVELLAGGSRVAVIVNAVDDNPPDERARKLVEEVDDLRGLGLTAEEIDLRDHFEQRGELERRLRSVDALWIRGGNTWILARAMRRSGADELIRRTVRSDELVFAGYSAAAVVAAPSLRGLEETDDPDVVPDGYLPERIEDGLGFLEYHVVPHAHAEPPYPEIVRYEARLAELGAPFVTIADGEAVVRDTDGDAIVGPAGRRPLVARSTPRAT